MWAGLGVLYFFISPTLYISYSFCKTLFFATAAASVYSQCSTSAHFDCRLPDFSSLWRIPNFRVTVHEGSVTNRQGCKIGNVLFQANFRSHTKKNFELQGLNLSCCNDAEFANLRLFLYFRQCSLAKSHQIASKSHHIRKLKFGEVACPNCQNTTPKIR